MRTQRLSFVVTVLGFTVAAFAAPEVEPACGIRFDGPGLIAENDWSIELIDERPTTVWMGAGFGYEPESAAAAASLWGVAEVGTEQVLLAADEVASLAAFGAHRVRHQAGVDAASVFHYSLLLGTGWRGVTTLPTGANSGTAAEISVEIAPRFAPNAWIGEAAFVRYNSSATAYIPVGHLLGTRSPGGAYLALHAEADLVHGQAVPLHVLGSFGGRERAPALAGAVRGFQTGGYGAPLKIALNFDLRSPVLARDSVVVGVYLHIDGGFGWPLLTGPPETIASGGGGAFVSLGPAIDVVVSTHLVRPALGPTDWVPFTFGLGFPF